MAKFVKSVSLQGQLDLKAGLIVQITKDGGEQTFDLRQVLAEFDGAEITLSIRESTPIKSVEEARKG